MSDLSRLQELVENSQLRHGPWREDGTIIGPSMHETDATNGLHDWVTFKTAKPDEDRALFILLCNNLKAIVDIVGVAINVRDNLAKAPIGALKQGNHWMQTAESAYALRAYGELDSVLKAAKL